MRTAPSMAPEAGLRSLRRRLPGAVAFIMRRALADAIEHGAGSRNVPASAPLSRCGGSPSVGGSRRAEGTGRCDTDPMRFFNTSGPVVPADHYCIPPLERVDLDDVRQLVRNKRCFLGKIRLHRQDPGHPRRPGDRCPGGSGCP